jgi:ribosomal protein L20
MSRELLHHLPGSPAARLGILLARAPSRPRHRTIYEAMLDAVPRERADRRADRQRAPAQHGQAQGGRRQGRDRRAHRRRARPLWIRRYAQIVREHALMRRLLSTSHEIQASVVNQQAVPREHVEQTEQRIFELSLQARRLAGTSRGRAEGRSSSRRRTDPSTRCRCQTVAGQLCGLAIARGEPVVGVPRATRMRCRSRRAPA